MYGDILQVMTPRKAILITAFYYLHIINILIMSGAVGYFFLVCQPLKGLYNTHIHTLMADQLIGRDTAPFLSRRTPLCFLLDSISHSPMSPSKPPDSPPPVIRTEESSTSPHVRGRTCEIFGISGRTNVEV